MALKLLKLFSKARDQDPDQEEGEGSDEED
jgi:hypothetical protein